MLEDGFAFGSELVVGVGRGMTGDENIIDKIFQRELGRVEFDHAPRFEILLRGGRRDFGDDAGECAGDLV